MKTILAFGDSLTWGYDAELSGRHNYENRWPSVLEQELSGLARVIPEGLSGRTTSFDDHASFANLNGVKALPMLLATHTPLDLVIIFLGTNDLKSHLCGQAMGAALGVRRLIDIAQAHTPKPKVLLVSPPIITEPEQTLTLNSFATSGPESCKLSGLYRAVATEKSCAFFDAAAVVTATPLDGVHLDAQNTIALGKALAPLVQELLTAP